MKQFILRILNRRLQNPNQSIEMATESGDESTGQGRKTDLIDQAVAELDSVLPKINKKIQVDPDTMLAIEDSNDG